MKIICFGDSLTACGGDSGRFSDILQARFPTHTFINKGVGGETFVEALARLDMDVLSEKPDIVLIELGANDWWRNERPYTAWGEDLETCITRCRRHGIRAMVLGVFGDYRNLQGELLTKVYGIDERGKVYQQLEAEIAARYGCPYLPNIQEWIIGQRCCWSDTNHPNEYGNRYVADIIEPQLAALLGTPALPIRKPSLTTTRDFWQEAVTLAPDRLAVVDGEIRLTYGQADALVQRLAAGLALRTGVAQPKIAIYLPNCVEYYLLYWAVQRLGGAVVPLNTWLKADSLAGIFRTVEPDALIVRGPLDDIALHAARETAPNMPVIAVDGEVAGASRYHNLLDCAQPVPVTPLTPETISIIMHTSGTTSTPKGAVMRHADLMFNVAAAINAHDFSPRDVHLLVNPMFHCTALYSSLPTAAYQQAPVIISAGTDPEALLALIQRERITTFLSVPSVFQKILQLPNLSDYDWSSLRVMAYAGSPMPVPTIKELRRRFPSVALHNFFGLTETISMTHVLRNDDVEMHPDSIGRLLPFVEALLVDDEDQQVLPGTPGSCSSRAKRSFPAITANPTVCVMP